MGALLYAGAIWAGRRGAKLRRIARAFVDLQDARHAADYDHMSRFPKATAQRHVDAAERALALIASDLQDPHVQRFLALVVFRGRRLD